MLFFLTKGCLKMVHSKKRTVHKIIPDLFQIKVHIVYF